MIFQERQHCMGKQIRDAKGKGLEQKNQTLTDARQMFRTGENSKEIRPQASEMTKWVEVPATNQMFSVQSPKPTGQKENLACKLSLTYTHMHT